jgi:hypothetical protein
MKNRNHNRKSDGFTLIEALFAAMLIGLVIAALAVSSGAFTMANAAAVDMSTAEFLIEEIRELTAVMPYAGLSGLAGTISPPIDVMGVSLTDFNAFAQQITVVPCGGDFSAPTNDFVRITVTVLKNGSPVSEANWIRASLNCHRKNRSQVGLQRVLFTLMRPLRTRGQSL